MKCKLFLSALLLTLAPSCASLANANLFSLEQEQTMGLSAYEEILANEPVITSGPQVDMVRSVMNDLVVAAQLHDADTADMFDWEVRVIDNSEVANAFALPGGKMAVYTGILSVAQGRAGLAVVMGHEIAHATKRHGAKAVTRANLAGGLLELLSAVRGGQQGELEALGVMAANQLTQLSFGRSAELEADATGLTYMAQAGFDPREAVSFWERMSAMTGGGSGGGVSEWLSTHPSHDGRIEQLQSLMPAALELYQGQGGSKGYQPQ